MKLKPLDWHEITQPRSDEDPTRELGGWEAGTIIGWYTINLTASGFEANLHSGDYTDIGKGQDPDEMKATVWEHYRVTVMSSFEDGK